MGAFQDRMDRAYELRDAALWDEHERGEHPIPDLDCARCQKVLRETPDPERFDVVIYEIRSGIVDHVGGEAMLRNSGFYNAEKRLDTVLARLNERYTARIVPAGRYRIGQLIEGYTDPSSPDPSWTVDAEGFVREPLSYENREGDPAFNGALDKW